MNNKSTSKGLSKDELFDLFQFTKNRIEIDCNNLKSQKEKLEYLYRKQIEIQKQFNTENDVELAKTGKITRKIHGNFKTNMLEYLEILIQEVSLTNYNNTANDNDTDKIWFKVGLLFADGQIDKLLKKHNNNYTAIAKGLGNKNYRPYISETASNSNTTDKNIYSNQTKVQKIYDYCVANNINVTTAFKAHLQQV